MFRQKDAPLHNACWQKQLFDRPLFWQRSPLSKNRGFTSFFFPSLFLGGEVDLLLLCPSPCLFLPSGFFWFLWQQVIAPRHVHRLRWESCCLLYLWNSEKHAGPAGQQHEIYIMWKIQGEFSCYTSLFRHLSEKKKIIRPQERLFLLISWPGG